MSSLARSRGPAALLVLLLCSLGAAEESDARRLHRSLRPLLVAVSGQEDAFRLTARVEARIKREEHKIELRLECFGPDAFDFDLIHQEYCFEFRRRADVTALALRRHNVVFLGRGATDPVDHLAPKDLTRRLIGPDSMVAHFAPMVLSGDPGPAALVLTGLAGVAYDPERGRWTAGGKTSFGFSEDARTIDIETRKARARLEVHDGASEPAAADAWEGFRVVELERAELERSLARGLRRALEVAAPSLRLTSPPRTGRKVAHGELRWIGGHRVVLLRGTPEQIGRAHGELLANEGRKCIDSVLHMVGFAQTVRTGRWFRHELEDSYKRLSPHIPEDHKRETRALAGALGVDPGLMERLNVFPESFHCSGFAVRGRATKDGKLYHGRILDYMSVIGLQDAATTFVVAVDGKIPFVNVGYAGFVGSVTGMNTRAISLGEMGGRGEGQWDGTPMATLMRRALEECSTLEEVMELWKTSPRTCEYFYVFADGKANDAVGVAATPGAIEFVRPGEAHPRLGDGIEDAVILSSGSRLARLRERVLDRHGAIDVETGQWLMTRPVAMSSNLHNVLFVPADGVLYVANADHKRPAAECRYVRLDLHELLRSMAAPEAAAGSSGR